MPSTSDTDMSEKAVVQNPAQVDNTFPDASSSEDDDDKLERGSDDDLDYVGQIKSHLAKVDEDGLIVKHTGFLFRDLTVKGSQASVKSQANVGNVLTSPLRPWEFLSFQSRPPRQILRDFNGYVDAGELLLVLGRPGAGCSTFLKTLAGETAGLTLDGSSSISYDGISQERMRSEFRGEMLYNQESDKHFPHLTVDETLAFAAACRTPRTLPAGMTTKQFAAMTRDLVVDVFGLSNARQTRVGDDFIRGISGGERKRLSIAEMAVAGAPLGFWDNSSRGLDSGSALAFVQALRKNADLTHASHAVVLYQASQPMYDQFDKVTLIYEGRQIFYGPASRAKSYFEEMGWECAQRQTTGNFLTGLTNPTERKARSGFENQVPRTIEDFERRWRESSDFEQLQRGLEQYESDFPRGETQTMRDFQKGRSADRTKLAVKSSPFTLSIAQQISLCTKRAYQRVWNDRSSTVSTLVGQLIMALVIGSMFYGQPDGTVSFFTRGGVLFFTITINALLAISEINGLYEQRPVVAKHASFAFCSPAAEAMASVLADIPVKLLANVVFNIVLYFLAGLRETPAAFFVFFLFNFLATFSMSLVFRIVAQSTRTISQAMVIAGVTVMALVIYAGFTPPVPYMYPWFSWIRYINPVAYAFESLMLNEFHGLDFPCSDVVPPYPGFSQDQTDAPYFSCTTTGSVAGQLFVSGDIFLEESFGYEYDHMWRNLGILLAMIFFFLAVLAITARYASTGPAPADKLVFQRRKQRQLEKQQFEISTLALEADEAVSGGDSHVSDIGSGGETLVWKGVTYDIKTKKSSQRLLDNIDGWVRPGCLTALMGVSGAGKTTLLDTLACRTNVSAVNGDIMLGGESVRQLTSFQRRTGYVQQQDLLTETASVREAIQFSAKMRQPVETPLDQKVEYAEQIIRMLSITSFADAIIGQSGAGLNVKQRKLVSIGVELAAKPSLLFVDEPTSGLDDQSAWVVVSVLRRLAQQGQTILCTIHQPSSTLFEQFDRLILLAKGGRTAYFGDIGDGSRSLLDYFERHGAPKCRPRQNPAEYMIEMASNGDNDWAATWNSSDLKSDSWAELEELLAARSKTDGDAARSTASLSSRYAMPYWQQQVMVTHRLFQQYWRTPSYVLGKAALGLFASLFISFSFFHVRSSLQELTNATFSVFMLLSTFSVVVQQIIPNFLEQRALYEVREGPSRTYAWFVFIIANIVVEFVYQIFVAVIVFACWAYPVYGITPSATQATLLVVIIQFYMFGSTFAHLLAAALPDAQTAGNVATFLFTLIVVFNGVFVTPEALPGFWIFLYRVSPLTYIVAAITGTALHGRQINCEPDELAVFQPAPDANGTPQTCASYLETFLTTAPGRLLNPESMQECEYCPLRNGDQFLASYDVQYSQRWRSFGIVWGFIAFNVCATFALYWLFRVKQWKGRSKA